MSEPIREVKQERTGWRDLALSQRHRKWGWDCPCVDIDFLFLEYDKGKAVALVEYKNEKAPPQFATHPTYQAMIDLATRADIPIFCCRYSSDFTTWKVTWLNKKASELLPQRTVVMTEKEWVVFLYKIRGYDAPDKLFDNDGILL